MQSINYTISNAHTLKCAHEELDSMCMEHSHVEMELSVGKRRSEAQNKMIYALYSKATRTSKGAGNTALDIRCLCKLTLGVPILRTESTEFREKYDASIKRLEYEEKIRLMMWFPVSSIMTTNQLTQYIHAITNEFGL